MKLLTDKDISTITELARRKWLEESPNPKEQDFTARCLIESFLTYTNKKKWDVLDGKIVERVNNEQ